jgi:hypothetical protein
MNDLLFLGLLALLTLVCAGVIRLARRLEPPR